MKFRKNIALTLFCLLLMNFQCDDDNDNLISPCDEPVVVDNSAYETSESAFYTLINAEINGDCLHVNISSSGCNANTWFFNLIDSENIAESMPPQRYLKLELINNEACLAVFNKEQSFDLAPLRITGVNEVLLNIEDFPVPLTYTY